MKKFICTILILIIIAGGFSVWYILNTPEYTLRNMMNDIKQDGITAIEPYLTDNMLVIYQGARAVTENPLLQYLISTDYASQFIDIMSDVSLKWALEGVERARSTAIATLNVTCDSFCGHIDFDMVRKDRQWLISNVSLSAATIILD